MSLQVGDPQEVNSIADFFCKDRNTPLLIGSVKSNMGHSEPASGLCSVAKVLIAMEAGVIPPNLHYQNPNPDIPALSDGPNCCQLYMSWACIRLPVIPLMDMHEASSYSHHHNYAPWQLALFATKARGGQWCEQACPNQLASLITSYLYARLPSIFMSIHEIKQKSVLAAYKSTFWY